MDAQGILRIGTRGSPLALVQANEVKRRLLAAHSELAEERIEIVVIRTSGDRIRGKPLREFGGKGLFTKEIEEALLDEAIDLAVHSMKDVPTVLPDGLVIACLLPREDPRDALLSRAAARLQDLADGAVVASSSLRRRAQVLKLRPDLRLIENRGNMETRMRRIESGEADAMLLAAAGLNRLGLQDKASAVLAPEIVLPAVAQGAIGIETRGGDQATAALLAPLNDPPTATTVGAERAFLAALDGSCKTPIAGLAQIDGQTIAFSGQILTPDGRESHEIQRTGLVTDAVELGRHAGEELLGRAGPNFFDDLT